jgi:hypothetical protein
MLVFSMSDMQGFVGMQHRHQPDENCIAAAVLQDSGMLYPIPIKLLNKPDTFAGMGDLPVSC